MAVSAGGESVWVAGDFGVDELDADTGRLLRNVLLPGLFPLSVSAGGGAAWIGTVDQTGLAGNLTWIDQRTGRRRVLLARFGSAQEVAAVGGDVWVLLADRGHYRVARLDLAGRLRSLVSLGPDGGWLTADSRGAWVCCHDRTLLLLDPAGHRHSTFSLPTDNPVWAASGSIWFPGPGVLDRLDERTGRTLARIPLAGPRDVVASGGSVYALGGNSVVRIDAATNRVLARQRVPGITQALSATPGAVWVAFVTRPAASHLDKLDGRTLRVELRPALY
jgi:hypothetical protein